MSSDHPPIEHPPHPREPNLGPLFAALAKAQGEMGAAVTKDRKVKVPTKTGRDYEYGYTTLAAVLEAARPALAANELALFDCVVDGTLVTTLAHSSGLTITSHLGLSNTNDPQAFGSALTYGRRYLAMGLLGLAPEDDDGQAGSKAARRQTPAAPQQADAKPPTRAKASAWLKKHGLTADCVEKEWQGTPFEDAIAHADWPRFVAEVESGHITAETIWGDTPREAAGK